MWRCVDPGLSDVSEERIGLHLQGRKIRERHIPEDDILLVTAVKTSDLTSVTLLT
jgi:hypothetical protein